MIYADGRQLWRVIGNLYNNTAKYAMPDTRVYAEVAKDGYEATFTMKNISEKLISAEPKKYKLPRQPSNSTVYSKEEIDLLNSLSIEEAYKRGLI